MKQDAADRTAGALAEARWSGSKIPGFANGDRPATVEDGYQVQAAFRKQWQDKLAGWKIGATAKPIMDRFGVSEPFCGPFYAADVYTTPARPLANRFNYLVIETEFAYRLGRDLPARAQGYTRDEIVGAIDAMIPAFELINCRLGALPLDNAPAAIADCGLNGGMVLGPVITDWRNIDVPNHNVRLLVDGALKGEGTGSLALGDPQRARLGHQQAGQERRWLRDGADLLDGHLHRRRHAREGADGGRRFRHIGQGGSAVRVKARLKLEQGVVRAHAQWF